MRLARAAVTITLKEKILQNVQLEEETLFRPN